MQNEKVIVRKARIKDVPAILKLFSEFMKEHGQIVSQRNPLLKPHIKRKRNAVNIFRNFIEKNIQSSKSFVNIAEVDGKIAGYSLSFIKDLPPVYEVDKVGYISDLYVKKEFRKKNIASIFKDEAFKFFRKKGIRYKSIMVNQENKHAHSIYKKWGFFEYHIEMRKN